MPNYKLLIEYDGTDFCGWQIQPKERTVQGELESALRILLKQNVRLTAAGRTDSGVHASGQVANFHSERDDLAEGLFLRSLNGTTGRDVTIHSIEPVDDSFNARFSARARQYAYHLSTSPVSIGRQYLYHCFFPLDLGLLKAASGMLPGTHNFAAFAKPDPDEKHSLCTVDLAEWATDGKTILFRIRANRFLRNMVRRIVGTLLHLARGKLSEADFRDMLERQKNEHLSFTAPAKGLFLEKVFY